MQHLLQAGPQARHAQAGGAHHHAIPVELILQGSQLLADEAVMLLLLLLLLLLHLAPSLARVMRGCLVAGGEGMGGGRLQGMGSTLGEGLGVLIRGGRSSWHVPCILLLQG